MGTRKLATPLTTTHHHSPPPSPSLPSEPPHFVLVLAQMLVHADAAGAAADGHPLNGLVASVYAQVTTAKVSHIQSHRIV